MLIDGTPASCLEFRVSFIMRRGRVTTQKLVLHFMLLVTLLVIETAK